MLTPKKAIPSLAVAMLALTGAGCSDDGGGGPGTGATGGAGATGGSGATGGTGGGLENALNAFCMKVAECFSQYTTVEVCLDSYNDRIPDDPDLSCQAALISYFDCGLALSCDALGMDGNSCDDEFAAIGETCFPDAP
jgi:hypothetical protein